MKLKPVKMKIYLSDGVDGDRSECGTMKQTLDIHKYF